MFFRKFYDVDAPEAPAATAAPVTEAPSIAALMAKHGAVNRPDKPVETPKINTENKEATPSAPAAPAPATAAKPTEKAPEPPSPAAASPTAPVQTDAPPKGMSWQEVLKQQQPDSVLTELGYSKELVAFLKDTKELDPKAIGFLNHWKSKGDAKQYLEALTTDYSKMAPEDVMKDQLRRQNPELTDKQLDTLYKVKVVQRYKLDSTNFSEDEQEEGRVELLADVKPIRQQLVEQQQNYLLPAAPEPKAPEPDPRIAQQQQQQAEYKNAFENSPHMRALLTSKALSYGDGDDKFDFPVDPNRILGVLYDPDQWAESMFMEGEQDGKLIRTSEMDIEKQILIGGIATYGKDFLKAFAEHYRKAGATKAIASIEGVKPPAPGTPAMSPNEGNLTPAAAMAKKGRVVRGGE